MGYYDNQVKRRSKRKHDKNIWVLIENATRLPGKYYISYRTARQFSSLITDGSTINYLHEDMD